MKRKLYDKLVLLVKAPLLVNTSDNSSSSSGGGGGTSGSASSSSSSGGGSLGWGFPMAENQEGESIRATAERALEAAIGPAQVREVGGGGGEIQAGSDMMYTAYCTPSAHCLGSMHVIV
jgi:hypothetical protein